MTGPRSRGRRIGQAALSGGAVVLLTLLLGALSPASQAASHSASPKPSHSGSAARSPTSSPTPAPSPSRASAQQIPLLAYFYIWFNPTSWNRLKIDYPLLGRYSSDDVKIMRQQVAMAKQSGITGFLVSWKDTAVLNHRLAELRSVAAAADFKLGIVLEGRDFYGNPITMSKVRQSFAYLASHYAHDPVFKIFGRPLVGMVGHLAVQHQAAGLGHQRVWLAAADRGHREGTVGLSADRAHVQRGRLLLVVGGSAAYPSYASKLAQFSQVVHQHHGLWIAPAAPGFDARLLGGVRDVQRDGARPCGSRSMPRSRHRPMRSA